MNALESDLALTPSSLLAKCQSLLDEHTSPSHTENDCLLWTIDRESRLSPTHMIYMHFLCKHQSFGSRRKKPSAKSLTGAHTLHWPCSWPWSSAHCLGGKGHQSLPWLPASSSKLHSCGLVHQCPFPGLQPLSRTLVARRAFVDSGASQVLLVLWGHTVGRSPEPVVLRDPQAGQHLWNEAEQECCLACMERGHTLEDRLPSGESQTPD